MKPSRRQHVNGMLRLSTVVQSSLDSHAGKVAQSRMYHDNEFCNWSSIRIMLVNSTAYENLPVQVTLRWEKGTKNGHTRLPSCAGFDGPGPPLEKLGNAILCPITVLLLHANTNLQMESKFIQEVLSQISCTPSKTLQWRNPTQPIIATIRPGGRSLDFSKPAGT
jgi:hypothetical protein